MERVRIMAGDLSLGMYVVEVDRPWLETPFLFQGFLLESDRLLDQVRQECEFVFVDVDQSTLAGDKIRARAAADPTPPDLGGAADLEAARRAFKLRNEVKGYVDQALQDVRLGKGVQVEPAREMVRTVAETVVRNVNAMLWFTNLRNQDEYTSIHCVNVCVLAVTFGHSLGLKQSELETLGLGALLHDIGKARVPLEVLNKPGRLTPEEWEEMKRHPGYGYDLVNPVAGLPRAARDIIQYHHERADGTGYPELPGAVEVDRLVRIASIADVYDAMTSDRCYRAGMPPHEVLKSMYARAEQDFGKPLVESFIRCLGIYPVGSVVELTNGAIGIITTVNAARRLKPVVLIVLDADHRPPSRRRFINLAHETGKDLSIRRVIDPAPLGIQVPTVIREEALAS